MDEKTKRLIETLKSNPGMIQTLFRSQDGQTLLRLLTQGDRGAALQQAAQSAAHGDTSGMVRLVSQIMQSPEGAELVERINKTVQK
jgi:hypothetical protein